MSRCSPVILILTQSSHTKEHAGTTLKTPIAVCHLKITQILNLMTVILTTLTCQMFAILMILRTLVNQQTPLRLTGGLPQGGSNQRLIAQMRTTLIQ